MGPLSVESEFSPPSGSPQSALPHWLPKPNILGAHLPGAGPQAGEVQCETQDLTLGRTLNIIILPFISGLPRRMTLTGIAGPPLPTLWSFFFLSL